MRSLHLAFPLALLLSASSAAIAAEDIRDFVREYRQDQSEHRLTLLGGLSFNQLSVNTIAISGMGFRAGFRYAAQDKLAGSLVLGQVLASEPIGSLLFTELEVQASYCILGNFIRRDTHHLVNGKEIVTLTGDNSRALSIGLMLSQTLISVGNFNMMTGLGVTAEYEFQILRAIKNSVGVRFSRVQNNLNTMTLGSISVGFMARP